MSEKEKKQKEKEKKDKEKKKKTMLQARGAPPPHSHLAPIQRLQRDIPRLPPLQQAARPPPGPLRPHLAGEGVVHVAGAAPGLEEQGADDDGDGAAGHGGSGGHGVEVEA